MSGSSQRLMALETLINTNQPDFYIVGTSLSEIREHLLFKIKARTFEDYLQNQWDMSRAHAYRMIYAAQVINCLSPIGDILPKNEAQARPLTALAPSKMKTVWTLFLQSEQPLTARNIRRFVLSYNKQQSKIQSMELISEAYQQAVKTLLHQIEINQKANWKTTSQKTALRWNKVCKKKIMAQSHE